MRREQQGHQINLQDQVRMWQASATDSFRSRGGDRKDEQGLDQQARLWPTPDSSVSNDGEEPETFELRRAAEMAKGQNGNGMGVPLPMAAKMWPAPNTAIQGADRSRRDNGRANSTLPTAVELWPSPQARDYKGADQQPVDRGNARPLNEVAVVWSSPRATDGEKGSPQQSFGEGGGVPPAAQATNWQTPRTQRGAYTRDKGKKGDERLTLEGQARFFPLDPEPSTSGAQSSKERRSLNPRSQKRQLNASFVEWLMNWPSGWTETALVPSLKSDPVKHCRSCGRQLLRKRIGERLEDRGVFLRRQYCDRSCMAADMRKPDSVLTRSAIQAKYQSSKKSACEACGSSENLQLHHKDRNWRNNSPDNHQTLCSTCHMMLHHAHGDIVPKQKPVPCEVCGNPSYRNSERLCSTCRSRWRRHRKRASNDSVSWETALSLFKRRMRFALSTLVIYDQPEEKQQSLF